MKPAAPDESRKAAAAVNTAGSAPSKGGDAAHTGDDENVRALVARAQSGDEAAFRAIFDLYHRRAFAVAVSVVKNRQDALDVVQDAFIKVHRHIGNFQGSSSFYTWLYRIVMNLSIDHIRRTKKARSLDYDDAVGRDAMDVEGDGGMLPRILDGNPGKTVLRKELSGAIQAALDELPEYHRAVILLREVEGLSYEEMSQVLKVPKGTIMSRLFHARKKMQEQLAQYMDGDLKVEE
ncbi:MAG: sigma-70 family RNA polymerase sigma factor [Polyangiales bacterium]